MIAARRRHKRFWVQKYEARDFDEDAAAANMLQQYEARMLRLSGLSASRLWNLSS
jgi:hypothetical protein